jgi:hypothetical protein
VDLAPDRSVGIFEYTRLKLYVAELLDGARDVVNRKTLKLYDWRNADVSAGEAESLGI